MANFWDLPRPVRDKIYRMHLVQEEPITLAEHEAFVKHTFSKGRIMPAVLQLSKKAEREAAAIYYGENHFELADVCDVRRLSGSIWPRHFKLIRRITLSWTSQGVNDTYGHYGGAGDNFARLAGMKGLHNLTIRLDEESILQHMNISREVRHRRFSPTADDLSQQQHLAVLRLPGMSGLLLLSNIRHVTFRRLVDKTGEEYGGLVPGGPFETQILPRLRAPKQKSQRKKRGKGFRFLDLPPEIRNCVYDLLLRISGPIHPSTEPATTAPKNIDAVKANESADCESALSILAVNKQIHGEAIGTFYNANSFVFYYPVQMAAFALNIGTQRQRLLRDITLHYHNIKLGGVELIDTAFILLRDMPNLKKLHIIMSSRTDESSLRRGWYVDSSFGTFTHLNIQSSNPGQIPGMKILFTLRGISDIKLRDTELEEDLEYLRDGERKKKLQKLAAALQHINKALADAQDGKVNHKLLLNNGWHEWDVFPTLEHDGIRDATKVVEDRTEDASQDSGSEFDG